MIKIEVYNIIKIEITINPIIYQSITVKNIRPILLKLVNSFKN